MATNLLTIHPIGFCTSAAGNNYRTSANTRRSSFSPSTPSPPNSNWWSPLFGWSAVPDYIDSNSGKIAGNQDDFAAKSEEMEAKASRSRVNARRLRMMTTDTEDFHDVIYHSAIASRLASDFSRPSDR